jgi:hypothetical protein
VGEVIFNMLVLVGLVKAADRIAKECSDYKKRNERPARSSCVYSFVLTMGFRPHRDGKRLCTFLARCDDLKQERLFISRSSRIRASTRLAS